MYLSQPTNSSLDAIGSATAQVLQHGKTVQLMYDLGFSLQECLVHCTHTLHSTLPFILVKVSAGTICCELEHAISCGASYKLLLGDLHGSKEEALQASSLTSRC